MSDGRLTVPWLLKKVMSLTRVQLVKRMRKGVASLGLFQRPREDVSKQLLVVAKSSQPARPADAIEQSDGYDRIDCSRKALQTQNGRPRALRDRVGYAMGEREGAAASRVSGASIR